MNLYQQGDVLIESVETKGIKQLLSAKTEKPKQSLFEAEITGQQNRSVGEELSVCLAEGEATGHQHRAVGEGVAIWEFRGERYLNAPNGAEVVHPEHKTIRIPPGDYRIDRVRECDHFEEAAKEAKQPRKVNWRRVRD